MKQNSMKKKSITKKKKENNLKSMLPLLLIKSFNITTGKTKF